MNRNKTLFVVIATLVGWGMYFVFVYPAIDNRLAKGIELVSGVLMTLIFGVVYLAAKLVWKNDKSAGQSAPEFLLFGFPVPQINVLTGGLLFFGTLSFAIGLNDMRNAMASLAWPSAAGTVTEVAVTDEVQNVLSNDVSRFRDSNTREVTSYWLRIQYQYEVNKQRYTGHRARFGSPLGGTPDEARNAIDLHPVGQDVTVYYDPSNPEEAVLYRHIEKGVIFITTAGGVLLLAGIWLTVLRLRRVFT